MPYQVLARKWRPQQFDDVIGQPAVTRTLKNAIATKRIAQAFVFAGPRGVGKTTTARILARALNCVKGPTGDPCGECDACREITEGRDIDVLEIDAATHTGVENVRDVIINGLSFMPVRNRYKVFIIDEVHQLSSSSFNALLKSIEEPPPHVVFMMATTELSKIPDTVLSRSQVFEFKTISTKQIADHLRTIAAAERITVDDAALLLIARAAEGSMRDAESAFDQVIAFAGQTISPDDVATVLGLVGRDLVLDIVTAVADETPASAFDLSGRAVELGYDLRLVCRELSRVVRDLLVLSVDPTRITDPEIAAESERDRLMQLAARFSREDLMRSFDVLSRAEHDIRVATQPRYHLEMALLRWMHMRKLVPLTELLTGAPSSIVHRPASIVGPSSSMVEPPSLSVQRPASSGQRPGSSVERPAARTERAVEKPEGASPPATKPSPMINERRQTMDDGRSTIDDRRSVVPGAEREAFLDEIKRSKMFFYNTVVAQAQKIDFGPERVTFTFLPAHRTLREQLEQNRQWLESLAGVVSGRKMPVVAAQQDTPQEPAAFVATGAAGAPAKPADLKATAMSDAAVQAMLDVFPAEIEDVEEI